MTTRKWSAFSSIVALTLGMGLFMNPPSVLAKHHGEDLINNDNNNWHYHNNWNNNNNNGDDDIRNNNNTWAGDSSVPVPEPSVLLLAGSGMAGLALYRKWGGERTGP